MKSLKIILTVLIIPIALKASTPPEKVAQAMKQKFPNIKNMHWGKESKNEWEAEFTYDGVEMSALFNTDGEWLETETKIPTTNLPKEISKVIQANYKGQTLVGVDRIETNKNETLYEAELKSGIKIKEVVFNSDGTIHK